MRSIYDMNYNSLFFACAVFLVGAACVHAQEPTSGFSNTGEALSTITVNAEQEDVRVLEMPLEKKEVFTLFAQRPVLEPSALNFFAYWVQESIRLGIPANTIILVLLVPLLATIVVFVRLVVGLPSLEMLVPIILSFTFVALGISVGVLILGAIVAASFFSRVVLRRLSIMHLPKRSISLLALSIFVLAALTASISFGIGDVRDASIFPVLILILLGDKIVSVQLRKNMKEALLITLVTMILGILGYYVAVSMPIRNALILYPEIVFLVIPLNILMGRYFGMRLTEYFRFKTTQSYGSE